MKSLPITSISIFSLCTLSQAFPLFHFNRRNPEPIPAPQSYSVVPVDGGSSGAAATQTVTNVLTQTQIQTIISTITVSGSEQVSTIISTQLLPTTIVQTVPVTVTAETTMVVEPSVTSVPFDNGMWHTTYYYRSTLTDVLIPVSSPTAAPSTTSPPSIPSVPTQPVPAPPASTPTSLSLAMGRQSQIPSQPPSSTQPTSPNTSVAPQRGPPATTPPAKPTSTSIDWAHEYGSAYATPVNGSWWGKGATTTKA